VSILVCTSTVCKVDSKRRRRVQCIAVCWSVLKCVVLTHCCSALHWCCSALHWEASTSAECEVDPRRRRQAQGRTRLSYHSCDRNLRCFAALRMQILYNRLIEYRTLLIEYRTFLNRRHGSFGWILAAAHSNYMILNESCYGNALGSARL